MAASAMLRAVVDKRLNPATTETSSFIVAFIVMALQSV
jgi:hypothetical protein